jgi:hypothetical protein
MNIYVIKINNILSGVYESLDIALDYVYSLKNSNLINKNNNVLIQYFKINSCIILDEYVIDLSYDIKKVSKINYNKLDLFDNYEDDSQTDTTNDLSIYQSSSDTISINSSEEERIKKKNKDIIEIQNKLNQNKIDTIHKLNLLKKEKEKITEENNIYECDLKLYNKFKEELLNNKDFIIPFMFEEKYKIFKNLDIENNISFENFKKKFIPKKMITSYNNLFENDIDNLYYSEDFTDVSNDDLLKVTNQI